MSTAEQAPDTPPPALAHLMVGKTALVTVDNWFYGPDGRQYRAIFGTVHGVRTAESTLGVRPNGKSTNWYLEIGRVVIAGCQVHYAIGCESCTRDATVPDWTVDAQHGLREYARPNVTYFAD